MGGMASRTRAGRAVAKPSPKTGKKTSNSAEDGTAPPRAAAAPRVAQTQSDRQGDQAGQGHRGRAEPDVLDESDADAGGTRPGLRLGEPSEERPARLHPPALPGPAPPPGPPPGAQEQEG